MNCDSYFIRTHHNWHYKTHTPPYDVESVTRRLLILNQLAPILTGCHAKLVVEAITDDRLLSLAHLIAAVDGRQFEQADNEIGIALSPPGL
jgi:hypothetical protein